MNRAVHRATLAVASAATEALDTATVVVGGAIGAWAGHTYYPHTWPGDWRLPAGGLCTWGRPNHPECGRDVLAVAHAADAGECRG